MSKQVNVDMADAVAEPKLDGANKTMVQTPSKVGPMIEANLNTDTPVVPGNLHEFGGSQSKQYDTFEKRLPKIAAALGGKVPVVS